VNLKSAERTSRLLAAAAACFARRGFHRTTMDEIAREAGVSAGLIYRHFAGKDQLIVAIVEQHRAEQLDRIAAAAAQPTLAAALDTLADADLAAGAARADGLLVAEVIAEALRNPEVEQVVRAGDDAVRVALAEILAAAQRRNEIDRARDPLLTAEFLLALGEGTLLRVAFASPEERGQLALMREGLRAAYRQLAGLPAPSPLS
jgi:TetR/AcrR family transcriptional repressor of uid operon